MQQRGLAGASLEVGNPQPASVLSAGQGDVEQTQVFGQTLIVGHRDLLGIRGQGQVRLAFTVVPAQRQALAIHRFAGADERQEHQRILQALGLVDGYHLDQLFITFQAQDLLFASLTGAGQMLAQVADQRLLAIEFGGRLLQQFGQVQQVGQHSLTVTAGHQHLRQVEVMEQAAQHRQHTLATPD
ncbi:hypothetical protein D3C80_865130 [compost metagenome]